MYGVTELEKFHVLPGVAILHGLSNSQRDEFIRDSVKVRKCFNQIMRYCTCSMNMLGDINLLFCNLFFVYVNTDFEIFVSYEFS